MNEQQMREQFEKLVYDKTGIKPNRNDDGTYTPLAHERRWEGYQWGLAALSSLPRVNEDELQTMAETMAKRQGLAYAAKGRTNEERLVNRYKIELRAAFDSIVKESDNGK